MKIRPFAGIIAIILVSLITFCSCVNTPESSSLSGHVVLEGGASPNRVLITVTAKDNSEKYSVRTDSDGFFTIEDIVPSTYTVSFSKAGYYFMTLEEDVIVGDGKSVMLDTVTLLMKLGTFTGKVIDDTGNPISGASVTVSGRGYRFSDTTDANGNYSIAAKPGVYTDITVSVINPSCRYLQETLNKSVSADKETKLDAYSLHPDTHNYVLTSIVESNPEEKGSRLFTCTNCGDSYQVDIPKRTDGVRWAGIRASSYGLEESFGSYPGINSMTEYAEKMESCYAGSNGTVILIVGVVSEDLTSCFLDFPISEEIENVTCSDVDFYEDYLTAMDKGGYSVWLQVEPGNADLVKLAKAVMNHYKHHSCVKGFGIDVEWYQPEGKNGRGTPLDKATAGKVLTEVRKYNKEYTVFIKHWIDDYLTEGEPVKGFIYIDDSQGFRAGKDYTALEKMCSDFSDWAETFDPCPVMFQIGYDSHGRDGQSDKTRIWGSMENPAEVLGKAIIAECTTSNDIGIIWVDFTLKEVIGKID